MAQGKSVLDDIKKELECPVCQEQFSEKNEPKILQCQHTFCKSCLNGWLQQHGGGRLSCPNCRVITECANNNVDCLPTNLGFKNLGDILKAHGASNNDDHRDIRSQEQNICKRHRKNLEHYCEQCRICICSDCVIVEHRDPNNHKIVSVEDGAKKLAEIITEKLRSVEVNTSRLRSDIATLEERREIFKTNIVQAAKVVRNMTESYINLIRQHEASVTVQLARERSLNDNAISQELSKLTDKLERMANAAIRGRAILENHNHNIDEMTSIKQVLDDLISEKVTPLLRYPDLEYIPNEPPRNLTTGKLCITHTEPSLSVVTGEGLTRGIRSQEANFTVTTKDSTGQTTYCEIDKVTVEVTSERRGIKNIPVIIKDLKDGRYSVFYTPNAVGDFRVSIKARDEPIRGSPFKLRIKNIPKPVVLGGTSKFQGVELPSNWIPQPRDQQGIEQAVHLVRLDPHLHIQEYQDVQARFQQTCGNQVVKIERVQNPTLYGTYMIRKRKMDLGKVTGFGNGVYFSKHASYSARSNYSPRDGSGYRFMYLARVLVGEYTVGRHGLLTPPPKDPNYPTVLYDSVVDQIPNPSIFVVFFDWQSYPEYLITFV
ncbi:Poly [ADP-ribose] polymerase 15 [Stylophora pistillata]|uniref:Poly [ADP-ribose] polymerase n=1 Tax=Stylophora pistillata TaxID=50429 RepID=A0A2B4REE6_STYPI|nr:Poly [ADP-ribose] polymerase 15 [Stylophora pistillata]